MNKIDSIENSVFPALRGGQVDYAAVLVYADWCPPCTQTKNTIFSYIQQNGAGRVSFHMINIETHLGEVRKYHDVKSLPTIFIFGREQLGKPLYIHTGPIRDSRALTDLIVQAGASSAVRSVGGPRYYA